MTKRAKVRAAGAVVLRGEGDDQEVLLIHRQRYDDWSLPKGKGKVDELSPATAVREVLEETGYVVRLGLRLPTIRYNVSRGPKSVEYWRAVVVEEREFVPNDEVDRTKWMKVAKAMQKLTYNTERRVLAAALVTPHTIPLVLVRHGKAMLRRNWTGRDQERRLTSRGRRQAKELIAVLDAYGVAALKSSSSTRCAQTLTPYAKFAGLDVVTADVLTEEEGTVRPKDVRKYMARLLADLDQPTAICGHRPVLPQMFTGLGLEPRAMVVGEAIVLHRDDEGRIVAREIHKPTA